jgi:hypothetical protein
LNVPVDRCAGLVSSASAGSGAMCRRRNPSTHTTSTVETAEVRPTSTVRTECNAAAAAAGSAATASVAAAGPASRNPPRAPPSATAAPLPEFHSVLAAEVGR